VSSELAERTDLGHDALLSYHNDPVQENLDISIRHFERAREICPSDHRCRVAVLRNLAMAKFLDCQISGTYASLDATISLYREALDLCHVSDPDRPGTLLYLAHALVYRHDKQGYEESVAAEVEKLMAEVQDACSLDSHEHRAAELVLQTCARCGVINSSSPVGLDELISVLDLATQAPPSDYFDRPQRLYNLALAYLRRFELHGKLSDLERSIVVHEEAIRLAPASHPDRPMMLARLGVSLLRRYLTDLERSIFTSEATLQWSPQSHTDWSWILADLSIPSLSRPEQDLGDLGKSIVMMEVALQLTLVNHPDRRGTLMGLGLAYLCRFGQAGDLSDLEKSIATMEEVLQSTQYSHPDWPGILMNLGHAYFWRFERVDLFADLDTAISMMVKAWKVTPESHPNRLGILSSLAVSFKKRFDRTDDPVDYEKWIVISEERARQPRMRLVVDWHPDEELCSHFEETQET
jgi:tetratricopeptide (TPR) repeat protein